MLKKIQLNERNEQFNTRRANFKLFRNLPNNKRAKGKGAKVKKKQLNWRRVEEWGI